MKKLLTLGLMSIAALSLAGCASSTPTDDAVAPVAEDVVATGIVSTGTQAPVVEETPAVEASTGVVATGAEAATGN